MSRRPTTMERVNALKDVSLFSGLDFDSLVQLAQSCHAESVAAGDRVFRQGSKGDALYVILEGRAQVVLEPEGRALGSLESREVFGEMAVFDEQSEPRSATVQAVTNLLLLRLSRDQFREMLIYHPELAVNLLRLLAQRVRAKDKVPPQ